jgi:hypothetical protein
VAYGKTDLQSRHWGKQVFGRFRVILKTFFVVNLPQLLWWVITWHPLAWVSLPVCFFPENLPSSRGKTSVFERDLGESPSSATSTV